MAQPSLRDFGYLPGNPTLERVGYSQISLREMAVGNSSSNTTAHGRKMSHLHKLYTPLGSEFAGPDTEMIPLKTTENP